MGLMRPGATTDDEPATSRREQILEAAADLFARHGFKGVSIYAIGNAVGISGPALYRHFASKEALLAEMLIGVSRRLLNGGRQHVTTAGPGEESLRALIDSHVEFALAHPALITVHFRDLDQVGRDEQRTVRRLQREYVEIWVAAIRGAFEGIGEDVARSAAHAVFGLINSTPHSARLAPDEVRALLRAMAFSALLGAVRAGRGS